MLKNDIDEIQSQPERIQVRCSKKLKEKIKWAAEIENRNMSEYLMNLAIIDIDKKEKEYYKQDAQRGYDK